MKLIRVTGNYQTQLALEQGYVKTIADTLFQHLDVLSVFADILQTYITPSPAGLPEELDGIKRFYSFLDENQNLIVPSHIESLVNTISQLYGQRNDEVISSQRGAILELLGHKLICSRYKNSDVCINSGRFVDNHGREITHQEVDVAAFSSGRLWIEAYECKLKFDGFDLDDCRNLEYLLTAAEEEDDYYVNIGIICFDPDSVVKKKIRRLRPPNCIKIYSLENIPNLQKNPFF